MEKNQIISLLRLQLEQGRISREEVIAVANGTQVPMPPGESSRPREDGSWNMVNTLYAIGAIIAIVGVSILVGQHWSEIGFIGRVSVTLGIALLAYILGLLLNNSGQLMLSQTLFIISATLAPVGTYVLLQKYDIVFTSLNQALAALGLFIIFAVAHYTARLSVLVLILTGFATWAYYSFIFYIFNAFSVYEGDAMKWGTIVLGLAYILVAAGYAKKNTPASTSAAILYGLGTLAVLSAGIALGGYWDFVYILFIFAAFYGSVFVKSQAMLIFGAIFLIAHVIKLTYRYFLDSLGWPVSLIISGAAIIAIGFLTLRISQRYLRK